MSADRHTEVASLLRDHGPLAPPELRERIEAARREAGARRGRLAVPLREQLVPIAAMAAVLAALALVLPLVFGEDRPDVYDIHALGSNEATEPAPPPSATDPKLLALSLGDVAFPNWGPEFGWHAIGRRSDEVDGRRAETVFYEHEGHVAAYTVLSGEPLEFPEDAVRRTVNGVELAVTSDDHGHDIVVFERDGKTCVLSGHVEHRSTLVELASWKGDGRVDF